MKAKQIETAASHILPDSKQHELFTRLCMAHKQLYGNSFTYTLLDMRAKKKKRSELWIIGTAFFISLLGFVGIKLLHRKPRRTKKKNSMKR